MMRALLARELRLAWRSGAEILNPALVLSDRHHPVSVRRRRRAAAAGADCAGRGVGRRAAGGAVGDGSVVSRRLAGRFSGAAVTPADAAGGGSAGEGGRPLDDEWPAAADRLAAGGAAAGDESCTMPACWR